VARRGRKPLDPTDPTVSLCLRMPSKQFDALDRLARQYRISLPETARRLLRRELRQMDRPDDKRS